MSPHIIMSHNLVIFNIVICDQLLVIIIVIIQNILTQFTSESAAKDFTPVEE